MTHLQTAIGTQATRPGVPIVNDDDSESSEQTITIGIDGKQILIATIVPDENGVLTKLTNEEAVTRFKAGENPAIAEFDTVQQADAFARQRSNKGGRFAVPEGFVSADGLNLLTSNQQADIGKEFVPIESLGELVDIQAENAPKNLGTRLMQRFLATDVDDPIPLTRASLTVLGSIAGAQLGAQVPRVPGLAGVVINPITGAITFGLLGAIGGVTLPEETIEYLEFIGALPKGTREKNLLSPEELLTVVQGEALLELATLGGITLLRFSGRGISRAFTGAGSKEAREVAARASRQGIALLPVMVGNREIGRGYVAVLGRFPFFATPIKKAAAAAEQQLKVVVLSASSRIGPITAWSTLGEVMFKDASTLLKKTNDLFGGMYDDVFRRADELGVVALPRASVSKGDEILAKISATKTVSVEGKLSESGPALKIVEDFINKEILPLAKRTEDAVVYSKQTLRQMDGLVGRIDQEIAALEPGTRRFARKLFIQLRQAVQLDTVANLSGDAAELVAGQIRAVDQMFSHTMSELWETAAAKRFGTVTKRGLGGAVSDATTRTPVDQLARLVVKMDSPQIIEELARIVRPQTMARIAATVVDDAIDVAMRNIDQAKSGMFDPTKFAKQLGLNKPSGSRALAFKKLLETSNSPLSFDDFVDIWEAAEQIAKVDIPNVSAFIARRATLGGARAILTAMIPSLAISGGVAFTTGSFLGIFTMVFGARGISAAISNPASARFLKEVMNEEATTIARRNAMVQMLRATTIFLTDREEMSQFDAAEARRLSRIIMLEADKYVKELEE